MQGRVHQRLYLYLVYAGVGFLLIGNILDAITNAKAVISPFITYIGTALIAVLWLVATLWLRKRPLGWGISGGKVIGITKLGAKPTLGLVGVILLLWVPSIVNLIKGDYLYPDTNTSTSEANKDQNKELNAQTLSDKEAGKIIVLVADFQGPDQDYGVTDIIFNQLEELEKKYPDVVIKPLHEMIASQDGSKVAREKGKENNASVVLWGFYIKNEANVFVTVQFEVLGESRELPLRKEKAVYESPIAELETFRIQGRLSSEMRYLTLVLLGITRLKKDDYDGAIARFTDAMSEKASPQQMIDSAVLYNYRGVSYLLKGQINQALDDFNQAVKSNPSNVATYQNRGLCFLFKRDLGKGIKDLNKAISLAPNFAVAYTTRANYYLSQGEQNKALADYDLAITLDPNSEVAYNNRSLWHSAAGNIEQALADINEAISIDPDFAAAYYNRGNIYQRKGNVEQAAADYDKAISLDPNYAAAYNMRGTIDLANGKLDQALAAINKAISIEPDETSHYTSRGIVFSTLGNAESALADFNKAINLDHSNFMAYYNRGQQYYFMGQWNKCIADNNQAIRLGLSRHPSYLNRGACYLQIGDFDNAIKDFSHAITLQPDLSYGYIDRSKAYERAGKLDQAIADLDKAISLDTDNAEIYFNRGRIFSAKGDKNNAKSDFTRVLNLPCSPALLQKARALLEELDAQ